MGAVTCQISVSVDLFAAGPNPTPEEPLGERGEDLHEWAFATEAWRRPHGLEGGERNADSEVIDEVNQGVGAYIMGRKMFDGGEGEWDPDWRGGGGGGRGGGGGGGEPPPPPPPFPPPPPPPGRPPADGGRHDVLLRYRR